MSEATQGRPRSGRRVRGAKAEAAPAPLREVNYRQLKNPFPTMDVFSADEIANMHETALRTLQELGMKVLLPEARKIFDVYLALLHDNPMPLSREMV